MRYQPFLYVLPVAIGSLPAGTILCAGNSIPSDLSETKIDIYASKDSGKTWTFVSSVASGGKADTTNGQTPVWEPFLMKLVHQVSSDGVSWGSVVNDVTYPVYTAQPGMTTIAALPNGKWIMTYEYGGGAGVSGYGFPSTTGVPLKAGSTVPTSSPYVVWTSAAGGANETLAVLAESSTQVFINTKLGDAGSWVAYDTPQWGAYSRSLRVMDDPTALLIMSAGYLNANNWVTLSVMKFPNL